MGGYGAAVVNGVVQGGAAVGGIVAGVVAGVRERQAREEPVQR